MKRNNILFLFTSLLLIFLTGFQSIEDPDFLKKLRESFIRYNADYPQEKIFLQMDKPFYKPGEDIWFNAFVLNSNNHKPTSISDVIYIELIDPKGNVSSLLELVVKEGTAHGDFALPLTAAGGLYHVRAYTQWMKNFGEENAFLKEIQVQRVITPRLLLKLDYEKEAYGSGDQVNAKLTVTNLKNEKVNNASVRYLIHIDGIKQSDTTIRTTTSGIANISFPLPKDLKTTDGLLQAIIFSEGVEESISRSVPIVLNKISVQFFPEGGHALANTHSVIAFKALNEFGKGADISGTIVDENNTPITPFESFHMGMGAFEFNPIESKKYFARIEHPMGNESLIALPASLTTGYSLNLKKETEEMIEWSIYSSDSKTTFFVTHMHGELVYSEKINLVEGDNRINIDIKKFSAGIAVFTLLDETGTPQCERLLFLNATKGLNIALKTDKAKYQPGEKVNLKIETKDQSNKPVSAKLSLSVADHQLISFADDRQDNLLSSMLLSSEVKGEIQEPSFYFDKQEPKAAKALNYLLMTQGWRRFSWKEINDRSKIISYAPEKVNNLEGQLVDSKGKGYSAEITLLEMGNKHRIVKLQTTEDGQFLFKNIDPTIPILLLTKKPGKILVHKDKSFSISLNDKEGSLLLPEVKKELQLDEVVAAVEEVESTTNPGLDMAMQADVTQLSEVVVTGYGIEEKKDLSGSIVSIRGNDIDLNKFSPPSLENILQGRVAGIVIQPSSANPGASSRLIIRGITSLSGRSEPLYVINGQPIGTSLNQNFSNGSMIGPEDIQSITVLHSPEASALYGSAASNGAILITTRSRIGYTPFKTKKKPARYSSLSITPRHFSSTREFYVAPPAATKTKREDFRSTIYWNPTIVTNSNGEASVSFFNNDAVSAFRITAEGFSGNGLLGRSEEVYSTQLPFSLDAKLPEFLGFEDVLKLPVSIKNETSSLLSGKLTIDLPESLSVKELTNISIEVPASSSKQFWFTISSKSIEGEFPIAIKLKSPDYQDEIKQVIKVQPVGFPVRLSFSAKELDKSVRFSIHEAEQHSIKAELCAFPDILSDLFTGAEAILQEPYGCFEQTSSSTYPNVLALQFLQQSGAINPAVQKKALNYISTGYKRLISYEVPGGGFEWFGKPPAHEALTAYGLIEFHEMKKVFPDVDDKMIKRTREWLLSRRKGDGTFQLQSHGMDDFSKPSGDVSNAYITYALSETGEKELDKEYSYNLTEAWKSKDMYQLALMGNTSFNLIKTNDYNQLIHYFNTKTSSGLMENLQANHSVVWSQGVSLNNETTALWALALMKSDNKYLPKVTDCINFLLARRSFGMFGSTQATILSLKALTEYARLVRSTKEDGEIQVTIDGKTASQVKYKSELREKLILNNFADQLKQDGEQTLRVRFADTKEPLPYSVNIQWYTKKPQSNDQCNLELSTSLSSSTVRVNETVRLTVSIKNKLTRGLPMTMAIVGIPAGLSAQPWQLKELQEKEAFDFYEIRNGKLLLYYRQMSPNGIKTIQLDLKADLQGTFTGAASSAYLYYTDEFKHWVKGNSITIL